MATSASALTLPRLSMSPLMPARASPTATMTRRRTRPLRAACAYALQEGQSRRSHLLPCGLDLEVIAQQPPTPAPTPGGGERPPLVFVHGSFHAAWCWAERWLPFFSRAGFPCFALSLRAQGESSIPSEAVAGTLETHSGDIADFIRQEVSDPPILIGHSFGGLIVQQYISCLQGLAHSQWIRACGSQCYRVQLKPASFRSCHGACGGSSNCKENGKKKASTAPYGIEAIYTPSCPENEME